MRVGEEEEEEEERRTRFAKEVSKGDEDDGDEGEWWCSSSKKELDLLPRTRADMVMEMTIIPESQQPPCAKMKNDQDSTPIERRRSRKDLWWRARNRTREIARVSDFDRDTKDEVFGFLFSFKSRSVGGERKEKIMKSYTSQDTYIYT